MTSTRPEPDTEQLLERAAAGDESAGWQVLDRHRQRLRQMIAVPLGPAAGGAGRSLRRRAGNAGGAGSGWANTCASGRCLSFPGFASWPRSG